MTHFSPAADAQATPRGEAAHVSARAEHLTTDRLDRAIWLTIAAVALAVASAPAIGHFTIAWPTLLVPGSACVAMLAGVGFYRRWRPDARLASALGGTAQLAAFAAVGAPLSYLAAGFNARMRDDMFDAADRALGFDWVAVLGWMNAHPLAHTILNAAYMSFQPQATITVLALAFTGRIIRLRVFLLSFLMTALITIAISAALPAEGAWSHYGLQADAASILPVSHTSWPVFHGLRDGTMSTLMAAGSEGIITFPSLHAALGLVFALAVWPVPLLRWVSLAVNALMIAGTPIDGSHYLVDVIAGLLIASLCWLAAERFARRAPQP